MIVVFNDDDAVGDVNVNDGDTVRKIKRWQVVIRWWQQEEWDGGVGGDGDDGGNSSDASDGGSTGDPLRPQDTGVGERRAEWKSNGDA